MNALARLTATGVALAGLLTPATVQAPRFDPQKYLEHVKFLASDELRGRGTGMPELDKAAHYIAKQFKDAGLEPGEGKSYFQQFNVTTQARLGKSNHLSYHAQGKKQQVAFEKSYVPFNFSNSGRFDAPVVFAGYGITAREYNYDDYKDLDVKDKFVLILRHEPQEFDEKSVFSGKVYTEHSQFFSKATNAKNHGARGVILMNDTGNHKSESDDLEAFGKTAGPSQAGIPFIQIKVNVAQKWFELAGKDLRAIQDDIDKDLKPRSFAFPADLTVGMQVDVRREGAPSRATQLGD